MRWSHYCSYGACAWECWKWHVYPAHGSLEKTTNFEILSYAHCLLLQLWGLCLEMVNLSNYGDPAYVRQLWDIYLKQAWEAG